jgi:uncharacterized protein (DUF736 family)
MSVIGHLRSRSTNAGEILEGDLSTLLHTLRIRLEYLPKTDKPTAPAYRVVAWNNAGIEVVVGRAWLKTMNKTGREGEEFITITLDDPSFPKPLNVAAFKNSDTGNWDIAFRRRQDRAV